METKQTMKLAIYKEVASPYSSELAFEVTEYMENDTSWVRLSEIIEVEFTKLPHGVAEESQIKALRNQLQVVRAAAETKVEEIEQKIQELLCIGVDK